MSISLKDFEEGNFDTRGIHHEMTSHPITLFLKEHRNEAFTIKDLVAVQKLRYGGSQIMLILGKLKKSGLINHKSPYYAWSNKIKSKFGKAGDGKKEVK